MNGGLGRAPRLATNDINLSSHPFAWLCDAPGIRDIVRHDLGRSNRCLQLR